ncbi:SRPBCC family protein [Arthrobacter sp.]|uniref:SRPBCC family protein n=1 Tax=Arthrobacter sp. TaxID=1667 RepID=UPI002810C381|nr:SRPBCC family protein [Arthrobacter sp.]
MVDVHVETVINKPQDHVAAYAGNPDNAPQWYSNIKSVKWQTQPPMAVGSKLAFSARFLGRTLDYVYEIIELLPGQRLVMRTAQGPFPMETTYAWTPEGSSSTRMVLRNTGSPSGFSKLAGAVMAPMMRRAMRKDLRKLKELLESS